MNELIPVTNQKEIEKIFLSDGLTARIEAIKADGLNYIADISTDKGRKACIAKAREITSQKVIIDDAGKELKAEYKAACDKIDAVRKFAKDTLDEVRDKVREPVTLWEKAEEERIEKERQEVEYQLLWDEAIRENDLINRQKEIERREAELEAKRKEQEAKERAEAAEKARIAREEEIARQAKERAEKMARIRAEEKAKADQERAEREKMRAEENAKLAAERAEKEKVEALEKAEREKQAAIEKAKREEIERQERERIEAARKAEEERKAAERKAANVEHQRKINREALECFVTGGIDKETAKEVLSLIAKKAIKHVTINY